MVKVMVLLLVLVAGCSKDPCHLRNNRTGEIIPLRGPYGFQSKKDEWQDSYYWIEDQYGKISKYPSTEWTPEPDKQEK